jgi:CBS domain-containing protein
MPKTRLAREIMTREVVTLSPDTSVTEAAKILADKGIGGAPVVDENGSLVGIISESDLIVRDVKLHFPTYIHFLDSYIYLESLSKFEAQLRKAVGARVADVMSEHVDTVTGDATVEDVATLMINKDIDRVPVVKDSRVVGIITKGNIVQTLGRD